MNGLLMKDWTILKKTYQFQLTAVLIFFVLAAFDIYPVMAFLGLTALMLSTLVGNTISYDETAHWEDFAAALPEGRRGVVRAKYQFSLLLSVGVLVLLQLPNAVLLAAGRWGSMGEALFMSVVCMGVGLLLNAALLPLLLRFGSQKGRALMIVGVVIVAAAGGAVMGVVSATGGEAVAGPLLAAAALLVGLGATAISYRVALRAYEKKEL